MKHSRVLSIFFLCGCVFLLSSGGYQKAAVSKSASKNEKPVPSGINNKAIPLSFEITQADGTKLRMSELMVHRHDDCGGIHYYIGVPKETDSYFDYLPINTGEYILRIPLSIIKNIKVKALVTKDGKYTFSDWWYTITLGDGAVIEGIPNQVKGYFGNTSLGQTTQDLDGVKEMASLQDAQLKFSVTPRKGRAGQLLRTGGSPLNLGGISFISYEQNNNGCYVGDKYKQSCKFESKQKAKFDVLLSKIKSVHFLEHRKRWMFNDDYAGYLADLRLETLDGQLVEGNFNSNSVNDNPKGFIGVVTLGSYKLFAEITFDSTADMLVFD